MSKIVVKWSPEGATAREWTIDLVHPAWDLKYQTELATGWPWTEFVDRLALDSAIAQRALLFTLRRRDETRLSIESVTVESDDLQWEPIDEPGPPKKTKKAKADGDDKGEDESGEA